MQQLLKEYKETLKQTKKLKDEAADEDQKVIAGMISNLEFCVEWLETGWPPDYKKPTKKRKFHPTRYWDSSMNAFISKAAYENPFEEIEERIDKERGAMNV